MKIKIDQEINFLQLFYVYLIFSFVIYNGYFSHFNVTISEYLSIEDITIIFASKLTFVIFIIVFFGIFVVSSFDFIDYLISSIRKKITNKSFNILTWFSGLTIVIFYFLGIFSKLFVANLFTISIFFLIQFFGVILISFMIFDILKSKKYNSYSSLLNLSFMICLLGGGLILLGGTLPLFNKIDYVNIVFDDKTVLKTEENSNDIYIGKTSNYIFMYNVKTNTSSVYNIDKIKSLSFQESDIILFEKMNFFK